MSTKICAISDLHGQLSVNIKECDTLCICGDIVPLRMQTNMGQSLKWLREVFVPWCNEQPCKEVFLVGGNHDFVFANNKQDIDEIFKETKIFYVMDEHVTSVGGLKIFGTPWCHIFGRWAFMIPDEQIEEKIQKMDDDVDILLTHDAPYGTSDVLLQSLPYLSTGHIGCAPLRDIIIKKKPKVCLHGHLHSTNHKVERLVETDVYCVSLLDEQYKMTYKPLYLDFETA